MSYLCDLFIMELYNSPTFKQKYLLFVNFLEYLELILDDNIDEESK